MRFPVAVEEENSLASGRGSLGSSPPLSVPAPDPVGQVLPQPPAYTALYGGDIESLDVDIGSIEEVEYIIELAKSDGVEAEVGGWGDNPTRAKIFTFWVPKAIELGMDKEAKAILKQATDIELTKLQLDAKIASKVASLASKVMTERKKSFPWGRLLLIVGVGGGSIYLAKRYNLLGRLGLDGLGHTSIEHAALAQNNLERLNRVGASLANALNNGLCLKAAKVLTGMNMVYGRALANKEAVGANALGPDEAITMEDWDREWRQADQLMEDAETAYHGKCQVKRRGNVDSPRQRQKAAEDAMARQTRADSRRRKTKR